MPSLTFTAPNGRSITINGPRQPTGEEIDNILRAEGLKAPMPQDDPFLRRVAEKEDLTESEYKQVVDTFNEGYKKYSSDKKAGKLTRAAQHARESFFQNTLLGAATRDIQMGNERPGVEADVLSDGSGRLRTPDQQSRVNPKQRLKGLIAEAKRYGEYMGMPDSKGVMEKMAVVAGQFAGAAATPESVAGLGAQGKNLLTRLGKGAIEGAVVNAATELPLQATAIGANRQEGYSATQAAAATTMGAALGAGVRGGAEAVGKALDKWKGKPLVEAPGSPAHGKEIQKVTEIRDITKEIEAQKQRAVDFDKAEAELAAQADKRIQAITPEQGDFRKRYQQGLDRSADDIMKKDAWLERDLEKRPEGVAREIKGAMTRNQIGEPSSQSLGIAAGNPRMPKWLYDLPKKAWEMLKPGGKIPRAIWHEKIFAEGAITGEVRQMNRLLENTRKEAYKHYGSKISSGDLTKMNEYLKTGVTRPDLPDSIMKRLDLMRDHRIRLSREMSDLSHGRLKQSIDENMDTYLHRAYRIFDDKEWGEKMKELAHVEGSVFADVKAMLHGEHYDRLAGEATNKGLTGKEFDNYIDDRLVGEVNKLIDIGRDAGDIWQVISTKGRDVSTITKRKSIPEVVRKLWGEYDDPFINYGNTITKMANLVEMTKFYDDMAIKGSRAGWLSQRPEGQNFVQLPESPRYGSIAGKYTTEEMHHILTTFDDLSPVKNDWAKAYIGANAWVNLGKTVGSPTTQLRNIESGFLMVMANGHINPKHFNKAFRRTIADVLNKEGNIRIDQIKKYASLGLFDETPDIGEFQGALRDIRGKGEDYSISKLRNTLRNLAKSPAKFYQGVDNVFRVFAYESELARQSKARGIDKADPNLQRKVALMVRDTYPTYSNVGKLVKVMRRVPLVGNFMSFHSEILRTSMNTVRMGIGEIREGIQSGNKELIKIGSRRVAGFLAMSAGAHGATSYINNVVFGNDPQDREAIKRFMPEWDKNGNVIYKVNEDGSFDYWNTSHMNPYSLYGDIVKNMFWGSDPKEKKVSEAVQTMLGPFLGGRILTKALTEAVVGKQIEGTQTGADIRNKTDDPWQQIADTAGHVLDEVQPGATSQVNRLRKAMMGVQGRGGRKYNPAVEAAGFAGMRVSSQDPVRGIRYRVADFGDSVRNASKTFSIEVRNNPNLSNDQVLQLYQRTNKARLNAYNSLYRDFEASGTLGASRNGVSRAARNAGLTQKDLASMRQGRFRPYWPPKDVLVKVDAATRLQLLALHKQYRQVPLQPQSQSQ